MWLKALGRENGGHLQHALVILLLLEQRAGLLIDEEGDVGMELQRRGRH